MFTGSLFYFFFMFLTILLSLQSIKKTIHPQSLEAVDKWLKTATDKGLFEWENACNYFIKIILDKLKTEAYHA